jgi:hypothetical protein
MAAVGVLISVLVADLIFHLCLPRQKSHCSRSQCFLSNQVALPQSFASTLSMDTVSLPHFEIAGFGIVVKYIFWGLIVCGLGVYSDCRVPHTPSTGRS